MHLDLTNRRNGKEECLGPLTRGARCAWRENRFSLRNISPVFLTAERRGNPPLFRSLSVEFAFCPIFPIRHYATWRELWRERSSNVLISAVRR